jgi:predicted acyl esterase
MFYICALISTLAVVGAQSGRTWEVNVTTRDGVNLHTRVVLPRNYVDGQKLPVVIDRSPYGEDGIELLADLFVPLGLISVTQDMRGTGQSDGHFSNWKSGP